ncbi:hypothetical protein QCN29_26860 [Streptomyces sp. HNM0663]|uniref:Uncharacterized protein n=1 Tax=Streptomyces chengmaiensis TaxID=3040919 RepID=A0ABT6HUD3_9ACTN|nr:hypothetical protein [Streptomyces chengmaiensis]MDH2392333.1 hypothetical protein [Streptomyces chengmaiensis]
MAADPDADTLELPPVPAFGRGRPRRAARRIHPRRIARGNRTLLRRLRHWATAKNTPGRLALLGAGALTAARTANHEPKLLAAATAAYAVAAWRTGRPLPPTEDDLKRRVIEGVHALISDQPAIFLRDVYAAFQARPAAQHLDDTRLRAVLLHCGITIHKSVRIGDQTGRSGIKAADIRALLSPTPANTPPDRVDAGQSSAEEAVDQP